MDESPLSGPSSSLVDLLATMDPATLEPEKLVVLLVLGLLRLMPLQAFARVRAPHSDAVTASLGLTQREAEVLTWVARGKSNAEIAAALFIAPGTVKKHLDHIYAKLGVNTRTEAVVKVVAGIGDGVEAKRLKALPAR